MKSVSVLLLVFLVLACSPEPPAAPEPPAQPEPAASAELESILLPVLLGPEPLAGAGGRQWTTILTTNWDGDEPLWVGMGTEPVAIEHGLRRTAAFRRNAMSGALVVLPMSEADAVSFDLVLHDGAQREGVQLPVVRMSDVAPGAKTIALAAGAPQRTLRIYDLAKIEDGHVTVRAKRGETLLGETRLQMIQVDPIGPRFNEVDLATLGVGEGAGVTLELTPEPDAMRVFPMVVETDPESGTITVR